MQCKHSTSSCSPGPVTADAEEAVKGLGGVAAAIHHSLALQRHHGVPVARGRRSAHDPQTVPGECHNVQDKDVIHETACSFWVTASKDQHEVGTPHDRCMVGPGSGDVSTALGAGPVTGAEGEDMYI